MQEVTQMWTLTPEQLTIELLQKIHNAHFELKTPTLCLVLKDIGVFPKYFTEFSNDKNICHYSKMAQTCHLLRKKPGCYTIFKLSPIHASVIYQIP